MALGNSWLQAVQSGGHRFAAGIDISSQNVRLIVLSRNLRARGALQLEYMNTVPLPAGAMAGAEITDRQAVARALRDAFSSLPRVCSAQALQCAMAVPASITLTSTVPLARLAAQSHCEEPDGGLALAGFAPAVMAEAERIAGIERHALAADWSVDERPSPARMVRITAMARQHLEARIECAASAGISLSAVDGEPHAALRAIRYAANYELDPCEPYVALWVGPEGVHGWRMADGLIDCDMHYPAPEHTDLADALRDLTRGPRVDCALIGGEIDLLDGVGFSLADIGDVLGCSVLPLECALLGTRVRPFENELLHAPTGAVAFGLALRGVID